MQNIIFASTSAQSSKHAPRPGQRKPYLGILSTKGLIKTTSKTLTHFKTYLIAYRDGRVSERAVPRHADLHRHRLREEVAHPVGDLCHHHAEAERQQEDPDQPPTPLPVLVRGRAQPGDVDLREVHRHLLLVAGKRFPLPRPLLPRLPAHHATARLAGVGGGEAGVERGRHGDRCAAGLITRARLRRMTSRCRGEGDDRGPAALSLTLSHFPLLGLETKETGTLDSMIFLAEDKRVGGTEEERFGFSRSIHFGIHALFTRSREGITRGDLIWQGINH